jgi:hypothetical protein
MKCPNIWIREKFGNYYKIVSDVLIDSIMLLLRIRKMITKIFTTKHV